MATTLGITTYAVGDAVTPLADKLSAISTTTDVAIQARTTMARLCRLRRAAVQSVASATDTAVSWDTEDEDPSGMIAATSSTVTIPAGMGGLWRVVAHVAVESSAGPAGGCYAYLQVNGSTNYSGPAYPFVSGFYPVCSVVETVRLSAGDTLKVWVKQTTSGAVNVTGRFAAYWVAV